MNSSKFPIILHRLTRKINFQCKKKKKKKKKKENLDN